MLNVWGSRASSQVLVAWTGLKATNEIYALWEHGNAFGFSQKYIDLGRMFLEGSIVFLDVGMWDIWILLDSPGKHDWPSSMDKETEAQGSWLLLQCTKWADYGLEIGLSWIMKLWAFHSTYSQIFLWPGSTLSTAGVLPVVSDHWLLGFSSVFLSVWLYFCLFCREGFKCGILIDSSAGNRTLKTTSEWE